MAGSGSDPLPGESRKRTGGLRAAERGGRLPPVQLCGPDPGAKRAVADGRPYLLDIHTYRDGLGAASTWHPPYSIADLRARLPHGIFGVDNETLESAIGREYRRRSLTIATDEQLTHRAPPAAVGLRPGGVRPADPGRVLLLSAAPGGGHAQVPGRPCRRGPDPQLVSNLTIAMYTSIRSTDSGSTQIESDAPRQTGAGIVGSDGHDLGAEIREPGVLVSQLREMPAAHGSEEPAEEDQNDRPASEIGEMHAFLPRIHEREIRGKLPAAGCHVFISLLISCTEYMQKPCQSATGRAYTGLHQGIRRGGTGGSQEIGRTIYLVRKGA